MEEKTDFSKLMKNYDQKKWEQYLQYFSGPFNDNMHNFYNFMAYQSFCDENIKTLDQVNVALVEELIKQQFEISTLKATNDKNDALLKKKSQKSIPNAKKTIQKKLKYSDKIKKLDDGVLLSPKKYDIRLKNHFKNIKSIEDILKLEDDPDKFNLIQSNNKFKRLFDLIPSVNKISSLIGMKELKTKTLEIITNNLHNGDGDQMKNIMLMGPPGVGKTMSAKLLGELFHDLGITKNDSFIFLKRHDLIGKYCGHTAIKTNEALMNGKGGVIFIDEVYSLGNKDQKDVFTGECINTINQFMSENSDTIIFVAGYEKEIKECFLSYNPGLERRFPIVIRLGGYTWQELKEIFIMKVAGEEWKIEKSVNLNDFFASHHNCFKFYGGDMDILFRNCKYQASMRNLRESLNLDSDKIIKDEDIVAAFTDFMVVRGVTKDELPEWLKHLYN
jgi:SpoVK/Ycf46/Vps4 family AAA+-type ATPase